MPSSVAKNLTKVNRRQHLIDYGVTSLPLFAPVATPATAKPVVTSALHPLVKGAYQITDTATGRPFGGAFSADEAAWIVAQFAQWEPGTAVSPAAFGRIAERAIAKFKLPTNEVKTNG